MAMYALGIKPLINELALRIPDNICKQSWYADDSNGAGRLRALKTWWETLVDIGPKFGYHPKPEKTVLVVKKQHLSEATRLFQNSGVQLTTEGHRHLGAVIGTDDFKQKYVNEKICKWVDDLKQLSEIAVEEPQIAYAAFTKGISHRCHLSNALYQT